MEIEDFRKKLKQVTALDDVLRLEVETVINHTVATLRFRVADLFHPKGINWQPHERMTFILEEMLIELLDKRNRSADEAFDPDYYPDRSLQVTVVRVQPAGPGELVSVETKSCIYWSGTYVPGSSQQKDRNRETLAELEDRCYALRQTKYGTTVQISLGFVEILKDAVERYLITDDKCELLEELGWL